MAEIRRAAERDIEGIRAVGTSARWDTFQGLFPDEYIEQSLERWWSGEYLKQAIKSEEHIVLVAEEGQDVIGVAQTQMRDDNSAMLWKLYVLKEHRGRGIGTSLIEESIRQFPSQIETYYTEYHSENKRAAAFYASRGFVFDRAEEGDFHGTPAVTIYAKRFLNKTKETDNAN
jgi:ribosomal protein S18 acetylase RimI-like enzyme